MRSMDSHRVVGIFESWRLHWLRMSQQREIGLSHTRLYPIIITVSFEPKSTLSRPRRTHTRRKASFALSIHKYFRLSDLKRGPDPGSIDTISRYFPDLLSYDSPPAPASVLDSYDVRCPNSGQRQPLLLLPCQLDQCNNDHDDTDDHKHVGKQLRTSACRHSFFVLAALDVINQNSILPLRQGRGVCM